MIDSVKVLGQWSNKLVINWYAWLGVYQNWKFYTLTIKKKKKKSHYKQAGSLSWMEKLCYNHIGRNLIGNFGIQVFLICIDLLW